MSSETEHTKPNHPKHRHPRTHPHLDWAMPAAMAVLGLAVGLGLVLVVQARHDARTAAVVPAYSPVLGPRAVANTNLYEISVTGPVRTVDNDAAFTPASGNDIVMFAVSVRNKGQVIHPFLPSIQTYIRDDQGGTYTMRPTLQLKDPLPATDLQPGQAVSGELSYEIPKTLKNFRWYVDPNWAGMAPVVFSLSR